MAVALFIVCLASSASARIWLRGGDYVEYSFNDETGELIISGCGVAYDAGFSTAAIDKLVIEEGIVAIYQQAFSWSSIETLVIPASVREIGAGAFSNCHSLKEVVILGEVKDLSGVFSDCSNLEKVTLPDGVIDLTDTFMDCESLKEIEIPDSVENMYRTFYGCTSLEKVNIPDGVVEMYETFYGCTSLVEANVPAGVEKLQCTFDGCTSLKNVELEEGLEEIWQYAFRDCTSLTSLSLPSTVNYIGREAFKGAAALAEILLPENPEYIGYSAFEGTAFYNNSANWEKITGAGWEISFLYYGNYLIDANSNITDDNIYDNPPSIKYTVKDGTKLIAASAFGDVWRFITSVTIPDSVKYIGDGAFESCKRLATVKIGNGVESIGEYAFSNTAIFNDASKRENGILYIGKYLIHANDDIKGNVNVKSGTRVIAGYAFYDCTELVSINVPAGVVEIGYGAFWGCEALEKVTLSAGLLRICDEAFMHCDKLASINLPDGLLEIGKYSFYYNESLESISLPSSLKRIGESAFEETSIKSVVIPGGVSVIEAKAFNFCEQLESVTISEGVTAIEEEAFSMCVSLESLSLPDSLLYIEYCAFGTCSSLESVVLPDSLLSVGEDAFRDSILKNITIPANVTYIGSEAFCSSEMEWIVICGPVSYIYKNTFGAPKTVTFTGRTKGIADCAFGSEYEMVYFLGNGSEWNELVLGGNNSELMNPPTNVQINHPHSFNYHHQVNATCGKNGYSEDVCRFCHYTKKDIIPATGTHTFTEKIVDNAHLVSAATASSPAVYRYDCAHCDAMSDYLTFTYGDVENDVALGRPVNISAAQSTTAIRLTWSPVAGATGYRIYLKVDNGWKTLGDVAGTTATLGNLKPGTVYQYAVRAGAKVGGAVYLADSYAQIKTATKTAVPKLTSIKQNDSAVQFTWGKVTGATGYRVYGRTLNAKEWKNLGNTVGTTAVIKNLASGTKFAFAVRPFTIVDGNVIWSDYKEYIIATAPSKVPFNVSVSSSRKVQLNWSAVRGAEGYEIYYRTSSKASYKLYKKMPASSTSLSILNVKSGLNIEFAVRAVLTTPTVGIVRGGYYLRTVTVK